MLKRAIAVTVIVAGAIVGGAAVAAAEQYPPADNSISVSDTTPTPGQSITITARTFSPGAGVTVTLGPDPVTLGSGTAGGDGVLRMDATIPTDTALGDHTVTAAGQAPDGMLSLSARITVVSGEDGEDDAGGAAGGGGAAGAGDDNGGGFLPRTGSDVTMLLVQIGLALAALGGVLLALSRRRRRATTGLAV